jgi:hypothetical protein
VAHTAWITVDPPDEDSAYELMPGHAITCVPHAKPSRPREPPRRTGATGLEPATFGFGDRTGCRQVGRSRLRPAPSPAPAVVAAAAGCPTWSERACQRATSYARSALQRPWGDTRPRSTSAISWVAARMSYPSSPPRAIFAPELADSTVRTAPHFPDLPERTQRLAGRLRTA